MPRKHLTLTNTAIAAAVLGDELWDDVVRGLHLRCFPKQKVWYLYYRTKFGNERRPKLAAVDVMGLAQARETAREMLLAVAQGRDPQRERETQRDAPTVSDLFDRVYKAVWAAKKTSREFRRIYEAYIEKRLGKYRVSEVTFEMVSDWHTRMRSAPYQANRALAALSKMFSYAERPLRWAADHTNPCRGVTKFPERARNEFFRPNQLAKLVPALVAAHAQHPQGAAYLLTMLYTGARPTEVGALTPEMIDGDVARLDGKTGERTLYLPPQALEALRSVPWVNGKSICGNFPRPLWRRLRRDLGLTGMWARDTRRTFGTAALSTPHGAQAGELLGHRNAQTTKIYAKLVDDSARVAAAAAAARIDEMAKPPS